MFTSPLEYKQFRVAFCNKNTKHYVMRVYAKNSVQFMMIKGILKEYLLDRYNTPGETRSISIIVYDTMVQLASLDHVILFDYDKSFYNVSGNTIDNIFKNLFPEGEEVIMKME